MSYGELIKTAFHITRRNRYLWFFGFFAGGGLFNLVGNVPSGSGDEDDPVTDVISSIEPSVLITFLVVLVLLLLASLVITALSQGALIESVAAIDRGGQRSFATAWKAGARTFWRVVLWAILLFVIALGLLAAVGIPVGGIFFGVFSATESLGVRIGVGVLLALIALVALLVLFVPLGIVSSLSLRHLVLRNERVAESLRHGYRMFRGRLGPVLIVWLIQVGLGLGIGVAVFVVVLLAVAVLAVPIVALAAADLVGVAIVIGVLAALVLVPLFVVLTAVLTTFTHAIWTLAYMRLSLWDAGPAAAAPS